MNSNATTQSTANSEQLKRTAATLPKILKTIEENQVTILVGQTGSEETVRKLHLHGTTLIVNL